MPSERESYSPPVRRKSCTRPPAKAELPVARTGAVPSAESWTKFCRAAPTGNAEPTS